MATSRFLARFTSVECRAAAKTEAYLPKLSQIEKRGKLVFSTVVFATTGLRLAARNINGSKKYQKKKILKIRGSSVCQCISDIYWGYRSLAFSQPIKLVWYSAVRANTIITRENHEIALSEGLIADRAHYLFSPWQFSD